ncbi:chemotaxis protein CheW [Phenylobacterium sp.]|jgi:purine-binding chemotaxis protein CheW|uniref:chemotaxis protein CheW n=1 Tax=Phenylobacterium sp. TaxID=1871053 RepID=UPI002F91C2BF
MPEPEADSATEARRFLTFRSGANLYALPAERVSEIIHVPPAARLPHGPSSLLGLANLRGRVLPLASLRGLLGRPEAASTSAARAIVLDAGAPVAVAVDAVEGLVAVDPDRIEHRQADAAAEDGEQLAGAFRTAGGVAKVLDIGALLQAAFTPRARAERAVGVASATDAGLLETADDRQKLITFDVADQEYGLALEQVREILDAPADTAVAPGSEALVLGVTAYRDTLLPLLSLRGLLGLPLAAADGRDKVVVAQVGGALVGLVADRMRSLIAAEPGLVEPTPAMLAARTGGEAKVKAIYRGEGGRRLVSILDAEQLFREDVMQKLGSREAAPHGGGAAAAEAQLQFLVFRLGANEFGLPIETVDEVARVPEQITRVPKTPAFLEGVINLRGEVLPVVDQRRRFDMAPADDAQARRLVVLRTERHRAGVIVDAVSEVLRCTAADIEEAPDLTGEATRLVHGVVNLEAQGRLVLLLDPSELLTRAERSLLDAFQPDAAQVAS